MFRNFELIKGSYVSSIVAISSLTAGLHSRLEFETPLSFPCIIRETYFQYCHHMSIQLYVSYYVAKLGLLVRSKERGARKYLPVLGISQ
jgi:hypothetical protein